ncbi:MAG: T9SS type A sorting domain-containing protein [Chitinophagaceae bacterium]
MKKGLFILMLFFYCLPGNAQDFSIDSVPVRLKYIQASQQNNGSTLQWSVVCLLDYAKFDIQRSSDGKQYTSIHQFQADKNRCSSSFEFEDKNGSGRLFYRIRVGDLDGRFYTSKTIALYGREKGFEITSFSPTIVNNSSYLSVSSSTAGNIKLQITGSSGSLVLNKNYSIQKGNNELYVNASSLQKGNYFITVINQYGEKKTSRFLKQ